MSGIHLHDLIDQSTLSLFEHEHVWLHIIGHVVMVIMPVAILFLTLRWGYLILQWLLRQKLNHPRRALIGKGAFTLPTGLMGFILRYSGRSQVLLSILALSILPITYIQLELPKRVINGAISADSLDTTSWTFNNHLDQVDYLLFLCTLFLASLLASACLKYILNVSMGTTSERLLRHIRLSVLRKYSATKRTNDNSALVPVITQEVEPVCTFSGDAFIVPLLHGGTVVTIITFMMMQNIILGAAAITLLPIQIVIIPKLQRKINVLIRKRVSVIRSLSTALQKTANRKLIRGEIRNLQTIRQSIFRTKFLMKSLNNFIMNLTPFFFYTIGGYLVLENHLSLGALVASLASYKDLAPAIRELFNYYQRIHDAKLRYAEVQQFFKAV
jgi:hypothetical protein